jgi:hypothetical protein
MSEAKRPLRSSVTDTPSFFHASATLQLMRNKRLSRPDSHPYSNRSLSIRKSFDPVPSKGLSLEKSVQ